MDFPVKAPHVTVPLGTMLPFFFEDRSRSFCIIPAFFWRQKAKAIETKSGLVFPDDDTFDKLSYYASDIIPFIDTLFELFGEIYAEVSKDPNASTDDFLKAYFADQNVDTAILTLLFGRPWWNGLFHHVENFHHPLACTMRRALYQGGIKQLMRRDTQLTKTDFALDGTGEYQPSERIIPAYPIEDIDFRSRGAYSGYNWEIFFHIPYYVATRLAQDQQFEDAFRWFNYIFDPTGSAGGNGRQKYWMTKPFFQRTDPGYTAQSIETILYAIAQDPVAKDPTGDKLDEKLNNAINDWRDQPFFPFAVARNRDLAFQKAVVVEYVKTAVAYGDYLFRQLTRESVVQADQMYRVAEKLMGPKPRLIPPRAAPPPANFNELESRLDQLSNALVELENMVPDTGASVTDAPLPPVPAGVMGEYFCIPPNDELLKLWDTIADRRFKIDNCLTLDGDKRMLALFSPPISPAALARAALAGISPGALLAAMSAPVGPYRFQVMVQKANEFVQEVRTLGQQLLAALEKKDVEGLALLRSQLEATLLDTITDQKLKAIAEANEQKKAAGLAIQGAVDRQSYYTGREKVSGGETAALGFQITAGALQAIAAGLNTASGVLKALPNPTLGAAGIGGSPTAVITWGPENIANALAAAATAVSGLGGISSTVASVTATLAGYERRWDDWQFQAELAGDDFKHLTQLSVAADARIDSTQADYTTHLKQIENNKTADAFMHSKYTNRELYDWMIGQISAVYFQAYDLAFKSAKKAERALQFELGTDDGFIDAGSWDSLRRGLGAADQLSHQIKVMEAYYLDNNKRSYELTRHVSLLNLDPVALNQLRATGKCVVEIPEVVFDMDYPGHYMRRIKGISVTVPCVVGPYTTVACKLTLLSNRYRRDSTVDASNPAPGTGYAEDFGNDNRFVYNVGGLQSIATSQAQNDSGMFEFSFRDDRFLPFEGCGAVGVWSIELGSSKFHTYDPATISDIIFHVRYTARDGGQTLRDAAETKVVDSLNAIISKSGGPSFTGIYWPFDLRTDFSNAWYAFKRDGTVQLTIGKERLPFYMQALSPSISGVVAIAGQTTGPKIAFGSESESALTADTPVKGLFGRTVSQPNIAFDTPFTMKSSEKDQFEGLILLCQISLIAPPQS